MPKKISKGSNLTKWQTIIVASTLFGIMFGSGNLIFPVHLGQLAGNNFVPATFGFIVTAVCIPILSVISIGASRSTGLFNLGCKVSKRFSYFFTSILYLTVCPLFILPRSASISYNAGLANIIGDKFDQGVAYLIFCLVFFALMMFFSLKPSGITIWIGKIINPAFLIFLVVLVITALLNPMGDISQIQPTENYYDKAFFNGFSEGYGTMDALSGLASGIVLINIVKKMGVKDERCVTLNLIMPGILVAIAMSLIYVTTIIMGGQSLGTFSPSTNGSIVLSQIANHYFGTFGDAFLCITVSLACLKTCIGLTTSCSTAFCDMYPKKLSYNIWTIFFVLVGLVISNFGLDNIIDFAVPVLSFLYPICIAIIFLALVGRFFNHSKIVYKSTVYVTAIFAIFDFIKTQPAYIVDLLHLDNIIQFITGFFPFADIGFAWLIPSMCAFIISYIIYSFKKRSKNEGIKKN